MLAVATIRTKRFQWLITFLKRRWILLSCAVVLLVFSMVNGGLDRLPPAGDGSLGVRDGNLQFHHQFPFVHELFQETSFHGIRLGSVPKILDDPNELWGPTGLLAVSRWDMYVLPLWLPLSGVLVLIIVLELRWRAKRAKGTREQITP